MTRLLPLVLAGCLVREDLYDEARARLDAQPHVWADCDGDGWGDPQYVAHLPEVEPACEGTWVDNGRDCDDSDPNTSFRSGALCADELADDWFLYTLPDRELLLVLGERYTLGQAEVRCGPVGWGGALASLHPEDFEQGLRLPDGFVGWVGARPYDAWRWDDGTPVELPFCSTPPEDGGLVVVNPGDTEPCVGGLIDLGASDLGEAPGFLCQRPL